MPYKDPDKAKAFRQSPEQKEKARARTAKWSRENSDKIKENQVRKTRQNRAFLVEHLGTQCAMCGATERLEVDHINPGLKHINNTPGRIKFDKYPKNRAHYEEQLALDNLRWLCYNCHRNHSTAQHRAAIQHFYSLPLEEQEKLIMEQMEKL